MTQPTMSRASRTVTLAIVATLALHLRAQYFGPPWQVWVFKPLTTALLILLAAILPGQVAARYRRAILAGLFCSLWGDVFLMLPSDRFVAGLASFLVAHLCYIRAFTIPAGFRRSVRIAVPFALYYVLLLALLWPRLGDLRVAVAVYGAVLATMGWQAAERWAATGTAPAAGAAAGAVLFLASDSVLAVDRFVAPFQASRLVVMTTYIAAQWLIARSVADRSDERR